MKNSEHIINVFRRLKGFSPIILSNQSHKEALRQKIVRELRQDNHSAARPLVKNRSLWPRYALAAAAVLLIGVSLGLFFMQDGGKKGRTLAVLHTGMDAGKPESPGSPLESGRLYTMPSAEQSIINFSNGTLVRLSPLAEFEVTELKDTESCLLTRIYLREGNLEADLRKVKTKPCFTVETEFMNIETIGSQFIVEVKKDRAAKVRVVEGAVKLHFFDHTLAQIHDSGLPEQAAAKLESLLENSTKILSTDESYALLYTEKKPILDKIQRLIKEYTGAQPQQSRDSLLDKISAEVGLLVNRKPPLEPRPGEEHTQPETQDQTEPEKATQKHARFILSTLEEDDPLRKRWTPSLRIQYLQFTDKIAYQGAYSLTIGTPQQVSEIFAWQLTLNKNLPLGKNLTLKVNIKADAVEGQGAALAILTDKTDLPLGDPLSYDSTRDRTAIKGSFDWKEYKLTTAGPISAQTGSITLYLLYLPRTTGAVYFDNITLEYEGP
jgi:hypothetical protein